MLVRSKRILDRTGRFYSSNTMLERVLGIGNTFTKKKEDKGKERRRGERKRENVEEKIIRETERKDNEEPRCE